MESDVTSIVFYPCPGCNALLEQAGPPPDTWLLCPSCGRPVVPPEQGPGTARPEGPAPSATTEVEEILYIGPIEEPPPTRIVPGAATASFDDGPWRRSLPPRWGDEHRPGTGE